jgi:hypothetical protein
MNYKQKILEFIKEHPIRTLVAGGEALMFFGIIVAWNYLGATLVFLGIATIIIGLTLFLDEDNF